jgi:hypothetical protein
MHTFKAMVLILFMVLHSTLVQAEDSRPKYVSTTFRLSQHHEYIQKNKAPDFWALMPYYVPQQDGAACGIASMTMLLNALRVHLPLTAADYLVTQKKLVEKIKVDYSKGLTLEQLTEAIKKGASEYGIKLSVEIIHSDGTEKQKKKIRELLLKNEKTDRDFILANFHQTQYTGDPEGVGHFSPIGAFNPKKNEVLVLDVDRDYYEPYWVSYETFYKGIDTLDLSTKQKRGMLWIRFE